VNRIAIYTAHCRRSIIMATTDSNKDKKMSWKDARASGDSYLVDNLNELAADEYAVALSLLTTNSSSSSDSNDDDDDRGSAAAKFRILSHRAEACLRLGRHRDAARDAGDALALLSSFATLIVASGDADDTREASSTSTPLRQSEIEACYRRRGKACLQLKKYGLAKASFFEAKEAALQQQRQQQQDSGRAISSRVSEYNDLMSQCDAATGARSNLKNFADVSFVDATEAEAAAAAETAAPAPVVSSASSTTAATPTAMTTTTAVPDVPKYQYYQDDQFVTVRILQPNVRRNDVAVDFRNDCDIEVVIHRDGAGDVTVIAGTLYEEVVPSECKTIIKSDKVLLKLKKRRAAYEWHELLAKKQKKTPSPARPEPPTTTASSPVPPSKPEPVSAVRSTNSSSKPRPYSSHRDWDKIERELADEEEQDLKSGEGDPTQLLFNQIYKNADEDTRRAMIKSFQTSGGTVLSTNWDEVGKTDYEKERTAPSGMEWKTWAGDKLPTKEDD